MCRLTPFSINDWESISSQAIQNQAIDALEAGKIIYFPNLSFEISEKEHSLLSPYIMDKKAKNISYDHKTDQLKGSCLIEDELESLKALVQRYALTSHKFIECLFPYYYEHLSQAKTSLRTVEIQGRKASYRKDDTRLHVDAFPSNPVRGLRILRLFTNVNPEGKSRVWRVGEPFEDVVSKMAPRIAKPFPGIASFLHFLKITKAKRSLYDHYMLKMHDSMKKDEEYQKNVSQEEIHFPPGSSWAVFTDQVSHAAMSGQHVFEQTFYLPSYGLKYPERAPLSVLQRYLKKKLL